MTCIYPTLADIQTMSGLIAKYPATRAAYDPLTYSKIQQLSTNWRNNITKLNTDCSTECSNLYTTCQHDIAFRCTGDNNNTRFPVKNLSAFNAATQTCRCSTGRVTDGLFCSRNTCTPDCGTTGDGGYACTNKAGGDTGKNKVTYTKFCP